MVISNMLRKEKLKNKTFIHTHIFYKYVCHYCLDSSMMKLVVRENPAVAEPGWEHRVNDFPLNLLNTAPRG